MFKKFFITLCAVVCFNASAFAANIEDAVLFAIEIANDNSHGYSQGMPPYQGSRESPDFDCSSLIYHALNHAGFPVIENWHNNPEYMARYNGKQYSGDADTIWQDLGEGWIKLSWYDAKDNLIRGDILCNPQHHVAFYIGDGLTVEAKGVNNPKGGDYQTGDAGGEIDFYSAFNRGWTEVYRYVGTRD